MTEGRKKTRSFGDFELLQRIGRDGPFHLFRARQVSLDRLVTLKVLPDRLATLERAALLRREFDAGSRLDHAGILRIYEAGDIHGAPYVAMAPVDGIQLAEHLKMSALPPRLAVEYLRQMIAALAHAHDRGIIHGSLRPEVVWLTRDGHAKLSGFGCPIHFEDLDMDIIAGSAGYLAPEQAGGRGAVGKSTDIYGAGALLYAMTTGVPPHQGASVAETCRLIRSQPPVKPSRLNPGLAPALDAICDKCLQTAPQRRYGSDRQWTRLLADLRRVRSGRTEHPEFREDFTGWLQRHGLWLRVAALLVVFGLIPAGWDWYQHSAAWETITHADAAPEQYARALEHFERMGADRPFDAELSAARLLSRQRAGQLSIDWSTEPIIWQNIADEWSAIQAMTRILQAVRQKRMDIAVNAVRAARANGYSPTTERERRLFAECELAANASNASR